MSHSPNSSAIRQPCDPELAWKELAVAFQVLRNETKQTIRSALMGSQIGFYLSPETVAPKQEFRAAFERLTTYQKYGARNMADVYRYFANRTIPDDVAFDLVCSMCLDSRAAPLWLVRIAFAAYPDFRKRLSQVVNAEFHALKKHKRSEAWSARGAKQTKKVPELRFEGKVISARELRYGHQLKECLGTDPFSPFTAKEIIAVKALDCKKARVPDVLLALRAKGVIKRDEYCDDAFGKKANFYRFTRTGLRFLNANPVRKKAGAD